MENGWVKIHRQIKSKGYYKKSAYIHLWVHLLLSANHEPKEFMWNDQIIIVKDGQLITGREQLSEQTGIPPTTIERILEMLESEHQIGQQKTTKYRLITIVNWGKYQKVDSEVDNKRTTNGHKQECKNDKNNKKYIYTPDFEEFWKLYPKKNGKPKSFEYWKKLSEEEKNAIMADIPKRKEDDKWVNGFIKDPERYIKYRQWEDEIKVVKKQEILRIKTR